MDENDNKFSPPLIFLFIMFSHSQTDRVPHDRLTKPREFPLSRFIFLYKG